MEECLNNFLVGKFSAECAKLFLAKLLGYAIIGFSFIFKVPIIINMLKMQSSEGLSYLSVYSEILIYHFNFTYGYHQGFPFSAYGESVIVLVQTMIILSLLWKYSKAKKNSLDYYNRFGFLLLFFVVTYILCFKADLVPERVWDMIGSSSIPLISISRFSQIYSSFKAKSTGPLSAFTFILAVSGALARVFTSIAETGDFLMIFVSSYSAFLNLIVLLQIFIYSPKNNKKIKSH